MIKIDKQIRKKVMIIKKKSLNKYRTIFKKVCVK